MQNFPAILNIYARTQFFFIALLFLCFFSLSPFQIRLIMNKKNEEKIEIFV